jgi:plasmid stabilization system protein ParE
LRPKSPDAARRAGEAIRQGVKILGAYPRMGCLLEALPESYREWLIDFGNGGYVVRYRIDGDAVTILAVRDQKRSWVQGLRRINANTGADAPTPLR